jgi:hypothetical protein
MNVKCLPQAGGFVVATLIAVQTFAHEEEIDIGRTAAGQIKLAVEFEQPLELPLSIFPGISGYATGEMGVHSVFFDDPANDLFQISPSADLRFILLAKDAGMEVWNDTGSAYMNIGESFYIGPAPFDTHPVWNLVTGTNGGAYSLTIKVHDLNGIYSDSDPVSFSFTPQAPVELQIAPFDSAHLKLTWTTNAHEWILQSAAFLKASSWETITNDPDVIGTNFSLTITATNQQQFFRLHKQ